MRQMMILATLVGFVVCGSAMAGVINGLDGETPKVAPVSSDIMVDDGSGGSMPLEFVGPAYNDWEISGNYSSGSAVIISFTPKSNTVFSRLWTTSWVQFTNPAGTCQIGIFETNGAGADTSEYTQVGSFIENTWGTGTVKHTNYEWMECTPDTSVIPLTADTEYAIVFFAGRSMKFMYANKALYSWDGGDVYAGSWSDPVLYTQPPMFIAMTPEPTTMILVGLGGIGLLVRRKR